MRRAIHDATACREALLRLPKLGQVPVSNSVVPDVDWTETGGRLARVLASRCNVDRRSHRLAGSAMR